MVEEHSYLLEACYACRRLVLVPESKLDLFHRTVEESNCPFCPYTMLFEHTHMNGYQQYVTTWKWDHVQQRYRTNGRQWVKKELKTPKPRFPNLRCGNLERGEKCECDCDNNRHSGLRDPVDTAILFT